MSTTRLSSGHRQQSTAVDVRQSLVPLDESLSQMPRVMCRYHSLDVLKGCGDQNFCIVN